jgi:hypothetical protein
MGQAKRTAPGPAGKARRAELTAWNAPLQADLRRDHAANPVPPLIGGRPTDYQPV